MDLRRSANAKCQFSTTSGTYLRAQSARGSALRRLTTQLLPEDQEQELHSERCPRAGRRARAEKLKDDDRIDWCERGESNPHGRSPLEPKSSASASSATFALLEPRVYRANSMGINRTVCLSTPISPSQSRPQDSTLTFASQAYKRYCTDETWPLSPAPPHALRSEGDAHRVQYSACGRYSNRAAVGPASPG